MTSHGDGTATSTVPAPVHPERPAVFATTHWSVVQTAGESGSPESAKALEALCRSYWYPLYAYVRRAGHRPQDAEDLTQAFFARFLEKQWVTEADHKRGRFRSFLLSSLKHFLANEWDKARAQKRGGRVRLVALDTDKGETRYQREEPVDTVTPDKEFDRRWALALLDSVLIRLRQEYRQESKAELFEHLKGTLGGERSMVPYARLGVQLGMTEGAVKVAVHRLRQRYRLILRAEIANTVSTQTEVEEELRHLFAALG